MKTKFKKEIVKIIDKHLGSNYVLLAFGSFAREEASRSSDVDLAIYKDGDIPASVVAEIKEELNEEVHTLRDIDLVNLTNAATNVDLLKNILEEGILWKKPTNSAELLQSLKKRFLNTKK